MRMEADPCLQVAENKSQVVSLLSKHHPSSFHSVLTVANTVLLAATPQDATAKIYTSLSALSSQHKYR